MAEVSLYKMDRQKSSNRRGDKEKLYANRNDNVLLIAEHGDVAIVEHYESKERFSVRMENLTFYKKISDERKSTNPV